MFEAEIARLTDQQALSIVNSLAGELAGDDTPEGRDEQAQALEEVLHNEGWEVDVAGAADADPAAAGAAARQLLSLAAEVPELRPSLEEWLEDPPTQEAAALPLVLAAPIVLSGCLLVLQVVGHTRFRRGADGRWEVDYDPTTRTPFDKTLREFVGTLAKVVGGLAPGGSG